jgi:hypothetical protein
MLSTCAFELSDVPEPLRGYGNSSNDFDHLNYLQSAKRTQEIYLLTAAQEISCNAKSFVRTQEEQRIPQATLNNRGT